MTTPRYVQLIAPAAHVAADVARRTIAGVVAPVDQVAAVSTGQRVAFAPGSLSFGDRVKLNVDHDPGRPVGVIASHDARPDAWTAVFRIPPGAAGDQALADAAAGLRDGLSVGADIDAADERDDGSLYVTAATVRHVALLSEPAFDAARVTHVAAATPTTQEDPMPNAAVVDTDLPVDPDTPDPDNDDDAVTVTAAGRLPAVAGGARVRDPYPYAVPHDRGGPSFVLDLAAASGLATNGGDAARWRRAEAMAADPRTVAAAMVRFAAPLPGVAAAGEGSSTANPDLVPGRVLPDRYVAMRSPKAPLYTSLVKYATPDFNSLLVPRTAAETGLSGTSADELTPVAPGTIDTATDTVTIQEVEGSYRFSRKLLMGSNPAIDRIALDALDRAWLADVETRAVAFFTLPANSTAFPSTYADGLNFTKAVRSAMAHMAADTVHVATVAIPAPKEYVAAAEADDTTERPLLPGGPQVNSPGSSGDAYESLRIQGVPLLPGPYMAANKTLVLDQDAASAVAWVTPIVNLRLEWTGDGNAKVLQLTKYSGVGFWAQYPGGVVCLTNSTPLPFANGGAAGAGGGAKAGK